jgi:hypothetical protein
MKLVLPLALAALFTFPFNLRLSSQAWLQSGADINGEAGGDWSGRSISLSADGRTVAIGAHNNSGGASLAGHVRVYNWSGSAWVQKGADIDGEAASDESGTSVSLSADGQVVAIGAPANDGSAISAGHVRVYAWSGSAWIQRGSDIDGEAFADNSGFAVGLSGDGNTVAIGATGNDDGGSLAGHVRMYTWNGTSWSQKGVDINGKAGGDQSGFSVSTSHDGSTVAIGAPGNDDSGTEAGHVRVYRWNGSAWIQKGTDLNGEGSNDQMGISLGLSADGNTLAVGGPGNDGNGQESGHVRVFTWSGTAWQQKGIDIDGENAGDWSGTAVALNSNGNAVAIGAPYNAGSGANAGHVRVYAWTGSAWLGYRPALTLTARAPMTGPVPPWH